MTAKQAWDKLRPWLNEKNIKGWHQGSEIEYANRWVLTITQGDNRRQFSVYKTQDLIQEVK